MPNIELARKALEHIAKYPEAHDQTKWVFRNLDDGLRGEAYQEAKCFPVSASNGEHPPCGTTLCMAGWVAFLGAPEGAKIDVLTGHVVLPTGSEGDIEYYARDLLGLSGSQANAMFYQAKTAEHLTKMVGHLEDNPDAPGYVLNDAAGLGESDGCDCGCEDEEDDSRDWWER